MTIAAKSANFNFLEAMMRAYMDGAKTPLMLSSGLEDYFLGTYYFNRGRYYTPVAGLTHMDEADHSFPPTGSTTTTRCSSSAACG